MTSTVDEFKKNSKEFEDLVRNMPIDAQLALWDERVPIGWNEQDSKIQAALELVRKIKAHNQAQMDHADAQKRIYLEGVARG